MKIGIIRCYQTRDYCPGVLDFKAIRERSGVFADVPADEPLDIVGFIEWFARGLSPHSYR